MHAGSIDRNTAAGRVYNQMVYNLGIWYTTAQLSRRARTYCVSTRISEVRHQIAREGCFEIVTEPFTQDGKRLFRYRMVRVGRAK